MEPTGEKPRSAVVVRDVGPSEIGGLSAVPPSPPAETEPREAAAAPPPPAASVGVVTPATDLKTKRGRPRKYEGKGGAALSPMPISASIPLSGDYSGWNQSQGRAAEPIRRKHKLEFDSPDELLSCTAGTCLTTHMLLVNTGEDVNTKIITFSQQGSTGIYVLSATGSISHVTLRRPNSAGGTLTHEGCFHLMSLKGSFIMNEDGESKSRSGGMSVALAAPNGQILAGVLAGVLIAATPVQIIWDEIGESDVERDKMLLELEKKCLEVYRRKIDLANMCRTQLIQAIADSEAELAAICSSMGERPAHIRQELWTR